MSATQVPTSSKAQMPTASTLQRQLNFPTSSTLLKTFNDHINGKFDPSSFNTQPQSSASSAQPTLALPTVSAAPASSSKAQMPTASTLQRQLNFPTSSTLLRNFNEHVSGKFDASSFNAQQSVVTANQDFTQFSNFSSQGNNFPTASTLLKSFNDQSGRFGESLNTQQPSFSINTSTPANGAVPPPDCPCHLKKLLNQNSTPAASNSAPTDFSAQFSFPNFDFNSLNTSNQFPQNIGGFNFNSQNSFGSFF